MSHLSSPEAVYKRKKDLRQEQNCQVALSRMSESLDISYFTDLSGWKTHAHSIYSHLSAEDLAILSEFLEFLSSAAKARAPPADIMTFFANQKLELNVLNQKGNLVIVLFMEFFKYLEYVVKIPVKFTSLDEFLDRYERFRGYGEVQQKILMRTANWVSIMLKYVPPKKNKGVIIAVVPRYVEGLQTRYVTGSGQTPATQDRVHIYEVEGGVVRAHRHAPKRSKHDEEEEPTPSIGESTVSSMSSKPAAAPAKVSAKIAFTLPPPSPEPRPMSPQRAAVVLVDEKLVDVEMSQTDPLHFLSDDSLKLSIPAIDEAEKLTDSSTPYEEESPLPKKAKLSRDVTWGIDIHKKMHEEDALGLITGIPPMHKSYHFAGEALVPPDLLWRTDSV